jgi:D-alanyl-D-alanine carboxypeptidase/D-alanyl-D-alanine-endopeptidase (penicillin-binding protein 4)
MKKYAISTTALILLVFWPTMAQEVATPLQAPTPERIHSAFESQYLSQLSRYGKDLEEQGLYVESLDGSTIFADHQSTIGFNPASVIKVATSFAALDKLGAEYRFETAFEAVGEIKKSTRTLDGDLILSSTGDPVLTTLDVNRLIQQVVKAGVGKVTGNLIVTGPFTYAGYLTTSSAVDRLENLLKRQGVRIGKGTKRGSANGVLLGTPHVSYTLREIVFKQNAHSDNQIAERLGEAIGGPRAVTQFLVKDVGIPQNEISVKRTSGLEQNRITPKGTVQLLRHLVLWLNFNNMLPQDVLPVAGTVDGGTLARRLTNIDYRGSVIGKTGTLPATDGGVSTLAGFIFTRDRGVLLFAIFNTHGNVSTFRRLQDRLVQDIITESGGAELSATLRKASN